MSYLTSTLRSLLDNLSPADRHSVLIVVVLADVRGAESDFVQRTAVMLSSEFGDAIRAGVLEVGRARLVHPLIHWSRSSRPHPTSIRPT
jgi:hypothetical protein